MGKSRNTKPYRVILEENDGEYPRAIGGTWYGIKTIQREKNRKTRHAFRNMLRSVSDLEELDDFPDYEDFRPRGQAKWDY